MDYELIPLDEKDPAYDRTPFLSYARMRSTAKAERDADIGDVVHFWDDVEARCRAAIVLEDDPMEDEVSLRVLAPHSKDQDVCEVRHSETKTEGTWHWPCGGH